MRPGGLCGMERICVVRQCDKGLGLEDLREMLRSCLGRDGALKVLINGGGGSVVSSCSSHLCESLSPLVRASPPLAFILTVMKSRSDFGLFTGVLMAAVTERLAFLKARQRRLLIGALVSSSSLILADCVSRGLAFQVRFDSVSELLALVRSVLGSKRCFSEKSIDLVSTAVVKAFLHTVDERCGVGKIYVNVRPLCAASTPPLVLSGVAYRLGDLEDPTSDGWVSRFIRTNWPIGRPPIKVVLLTEELKKECLDWLEEVVSAGGVELVCCQKRVDAEVVVALRRKSRAVAVGRLGRDLAEHLQAVSGAFPTSVMNGQDALEERMIGTLEAVTVAEWAGAEYLLMRGAPTVATLLLVSPDHQAKVLVEQAVLSLREVVSDGHLCFGGGCSEVQFWLNLMEESGEAVASVDGSGVWLLDSLLDAVGRGRTGGVEVDTVWRHCWERDAERCGCRSLRRDDVLRRPGASFFDPSAGPCVHLLPSSDVSRPTIDINDSVLVDCFPLKRAALLTALESAAHLASVGAIVVSH